MGRYGLGGSGRRETHSITARGDCRIIVVAASPINRIVISRMIERIYLKTAAVSPEAALEAVATNRPVLLIIDEGSHGDLDALLQAVADLRQSSASDFPRIVLIVEPSRLGNPGYDGIADAVIAKPIMPETLQPVVERLTRDPA
mgnify:CR=1 FL=1